MRKKWTTLLFPLLFVLVFSVIAACANTPSEPVEENPSAGKEPASPSEPANQQPEENPDNNGSDKTSAENDTVDNPDNDPLDEQPVSEPAGPANPSLKFTYPDAVRGIYVTGNSAGGSRFDTLVQLVKSSDLNAMVIDIKDDWGNVTYIPEGTPYVDAGKPLIKDPESVLKTLSENNIYPIARIVVFKDTVLAKKRPDLSYISSNGALWTNGRGEAFVNPFLKEVWDYNIGIAKEAAKLGFQEIQFDYVRFPEGFERRDESLTYSLGSYENQTPTRFVKLEAEYKEKMEAYQKQFAQLSQKRDKAKAIYDEAVSQLNAAKANNQSNTEDANVHNNTPSGNQSAETESNKDQNELEAIEQKIKEAKVAWDKTEEDLKNLEKSKPKEPNFSNKERLVQLRVDAVTDFVAYAKRELEPLGVKVSVDIFGYTATLPAGAPGIGQDFVRISDQVDVISSMIYPSHWTSYFGIAKPDKEPYRLVQEYAKVEKEKLSQLSDPPISRPWIQDFTASWLGQGNYISYGKREVEAQIRALNEAGIKEFLIWNAGNNYTENVDYTPLQP
ncbi:hypothetical protein L1765_00360 [Microaerobacter geothermalis]|uniref:putative glycoside hydrolase n=1 Tax=Microaerobacter geothermalis TaxID=674972 RepID=UPI001F35A9AC|nr:putative glycoside hydrolase [Microaerobacter geothermalis]MCF6092443.1 hypothetical protein [Microaerobacter geothermalis]